jgi:hypothetical protein
LYSGYSGKVCLSCGKFNHSQKASITLPHRYSNSLLCSNYPPSIPSVVFTGIVT